MIKLNIGKVNKFFLFLGILCIFSMLIFTNSVLAVEKQPILRVGIFLNQTEINIGGDGAFKIYNLKSNGLVSEEHNKIVKLLPHDKGIEILEKGVYSGPIKIISVGNTKIVVVFNGQKYRYRGDIEIDIDKEHRKLNVINIIGIEEYLYGVLKKEISPRWPAEALKTQAIAARTFAIFNMNKYIDKGYNICASTNSQAYGGVNHEDPLTNKAVDETRGVIMTYKGKPINAVYHSDSGGYTEDSENVWGSFLPYLRSVKSKFEEKVFPPYHTWTCSIDEKDLTKKLQKQGYTINSVVSIEPVNKSETGRISELDFIVDNDGVKRQKYNISFTDDDGKIKHPIILHNSPTGGLERILWGLIESAIRNKDKLVPGFKTWLSPIQVRIITVSDEQNEYAEKLLNIINGEEFRADFDDREETVGKKIRQSEIEWIPYTIIIGKKEQQNQTISIRKRLIGEPFGPKTQTSEQNNDVKLDRLLELLEEDTRNYPKYKLPKPFRKFSTRIYFRH